MKWYLEGFDRLAGRQAFTEVVSTCMYVYTLSIYLSETLRPVSPLWFLWTDTCYVCMYVCLHSIYLFTFLRHWETGFPSLISVNRHLLAAVLFLFLGVWSLGPECFPGEPRHGSRMHHRFLLLEKPPPQGLSLQASFGVHKVWQQLPAQTHGQLLHMLHNS